MPIELQLTAQSWAQQCPGLQGHQHNDCWLLGERECLFISPGETATSGSGSFWLCACVWTGTQKEVPPSPPPLWAWSYLTQFCPFTASLPHESSYLCPALLEHHPASQLVLRPGTNYHWPSVSSAWLHRVANVLFCMFANRELLANDMHVLPAIRYGCH